LTGQLIIHSVIVSVGLEKPKTYSSFWKGKRREKMAILFLWPSVLFLGYFGPVIYPSEVGPSTAVVVTARWVNLTTFDAFKHSFNASKWRADTCQNNSSDGWRLTNQNNIIM
jgi:hypothetical protein